MAITKIHAVKATVGGAVNYICDEDKTDGKTLITCFGCSPETAANDFKFTLSHTSQSDPNKAYHLIQSFAPKETDAETAHAIGVELADRLLYSRYSYIVATHTDHDHIHNHVLFCAADNIDYKKYHDCKSSYRHIKQLSDDLCKEHGLSVIKERSYAAKSYKEWMADKQGNSWKTKLRQDINTAIKGSNSYTQFLRSMEDAGYKIKDPGLNEGDHKYIAFLAPGTTRWIRGRDSSLGPQYTRERIRERIENKPKIRTEKMKTEQKISTNLIDTTADKFKENIGLRRWADLQNLKTTAAIHAELSRRGIKNMDQLEQEISRLSGETYSYRKSLIDLDKEIKAFSEILMFARQYDENKRYERNYEKSKDPERYYKDHRDQLTLAWGARNVLENAGIDPAKMNIKDMEEHLRELNEKRDAIRSERSHFDNDINDLKKYRENLVAFVEGQTQPPEQTKNHEKSRTEIRDK